MQGNYDEVNFLIVGMFGLGSISSSVVSTIFSDMSFCHLYILSLVIQYMASCLYMLLLIAVTSCQFQFVPI